MNGNRHAQWLVILTSAAVLLLACRGEDREDAAARSDGRSQPAALGQVFTLRGCVEPALGPDQFVLTTIQIDSPEIGPASGTGWPIAPASRNDPESSSSQETSSWSAVADGCR